MHLVVFAPPLFDRDVSARLRRHIHQNILFAEDVSVKDARVVLHALRFWWWLWQVVDWWCWVGGGVLCEVA